MYAYYYIINGYNLYDKYVRYITCYALYERHSLYHMITICIHILCHYDVIWHNTLEKAAGLYVL